MREIKNNVEIAKMQQKVDFSKNDKAEVQFCANNSDNDESCVKDFSNPTEVLGRSQVKKSDNVNSDVAFGIAHPQAISNSDKLFELAYAKLQNEGDPNAYEKACSIATSQDAKELLV